MKKILGLILAIAMMAALSVTAFAAPTPSEFNDSADVNGKYVAGAQADVYYVDVTWGAMNFTYKADAQTWDPEAHTWIDATTGTWTAEGNTITVANHSSVEVTATFAFTAAEDYDDLTPTFTGVTDNAADLAAPTTATATTCTATLTLAGTLPAGTNGVIGTVTVTLG